MPIGTVSVEQAGGWRGAGAGGTGRDTQAGAGILKVP